MEKCKTIFILDDDVGFVRIVSIILESNGYRVFTDYEGNYEFLLDKIFPDIIILDCRLGHKSGAEICRQLKENRYTNSIPVILCSGECNIRELANYAQADDFLQKPFDLNHLLIKIRFILENQALAASNP